MYNNKLINNSELSRQLGISRSAFENKKKHINGNFFTELQNQKLKEIAQKLIEELNVFVYSQLICDYAVAECENQKVQ